MFCPIALNQKNALFAGNNAGIENWAVIASLIETCKLNAVDPHGWLTMTLTDIAGGAHAAHNITDLFPWNYTLPKCDRYTAYSFLRPFQSHSDNHTTKSSTLVEAADTKKPAQTVKWNKLYT